MEIKITVNEERITKMVEELIAEDLFKQYSAMRSEKSMAVRSGIEKAVKAYIYSQKEEIIEKCTARATTELVRRGLPKFIESTLKKEV